MIRHIFLFYNLSNAENYNKINIECSLNIYTLHQNILFNSSIKFIGCDLVKRKNRNEEDNKMETAIKRPCSPVQSLKQSIKEMFMIRRGELPKRTWAELKKELESKNK